MSVLAWHQQPLAGRRVTVMGLGKFGGGIAAVRFLVECGAIVTVSDSASEAQLAESVAQLSDLPAVRFRLGRHAAQDFVDTDLVVVNPAVKPHHECLQLARESSIPITTEIELLLRNLASPVIAVTGSNGKSTTAALIHSMLQHSGQRSWLGGNIGVSLLPQVAAIRPNDWVVLELSSFQLHYLPEACLHFVAAVVTNFTPNHLDWHPTLDHYRAAKQKILGHLEPRATGVIRANDSVCTSWPCSGNRCEVEVEPLSIAESNTTRTHEFSNALESDSQRRAWVRLGSSGKLQWSGFGARLESLPTRGSAMLEIPAGIFPGRHARENLALATAAVLSLRVTPAAVQAGITDFEPLPHRLQLIAEAHQRRFYNDSLATTPESTLAAVESLASPVSIIIGGSDKGIDLIPMLKRVSAKCRRVALIGETGKRLDSDLRAGLQNGDRTFGQDQEIRLCDGMDAAVEWLIRESVPQESILLSPACASYDMFPNFAKRGRVFAECVTRHLPLLD